MHVGTECYSVTSQNICYDIPARTRLGVPDPDLDKYVWISTAFRQSPAKVCFQPPQEACSSNGPVATLPSPSPPPPSIGMSVHCMPLCMLAYVGLLLRSPLSWYYTFIVYIL